MGCTRCGTDTRLIELMFNKLIQEALRDGTVQAGLASCEGERLQKETKVVVCHTLKDQVCALIENGELCFTSPSVLNYDPNTGKLELGLSDGTILDTTIPMEDRHLQNVAYDADTAMATFTMSNGETHTLDLTALKVKVNAVAADDGAVTITNQDGSTVTIPAVKVAAEKAEDGTVTITNQDGSTVTIDPVRKGDKGEQGEAGPQGIQGPAGPKGDRGEQGPAGARGLRGEQGIQGPKGEPFEVFKTFDSIANMNADTTVPAGKFVVITSNVDDEDNAKLFVKGDNGYTFITDLSGAKGIKGDQGIQGIQGPKGDRGPQGQQGPAGPAGSDATAAPRTIRLVNSSGETVVGYIYATESDNALVI